MNMSSDFTVFQVIEIKNEIANQAESSTSSTQQSQKRKVTIMVLVLVSVFVLCNIPSRQNGVHMHFLLYVTIVSTFSRNLDLLATLNFKQIEYLRVGNCQTISSKGIK